MQDQSKIILIKKHLNTHQIDHLFPSVFKRILFEFDKWV